MRCRFDASSYQSAVETTANRDQFLRQHDIHSIRPKIPPSMICDETFFEVFLTALARFLCAAQIFDLWL